MQRLTSFFLSLILVLSLGMGAVVHATERLECVDAPSAQHIDHYDGDGDQSSGDAEKGYTHHHAECHGHHIGVPVAALPAVAAVFLRLHVLPWSSPRGPLAVLDPELRPPRV